MPRKAYVEDITPTVRRLKCDLFGHDLVILHEHDIRKKTGPFATLSKERRDSLMEGLTAVIESSPMTLVAVVIDKLRHKARYAEPFSPYDLALQYGLKRVFEALRSEGEEGKLVHVICEGAGQVLQLGRHAGWDDTAQRAERVRRWRRAPKRGDAMRVRQIDTAPSLL